MLDHVTYCCKGIVRVTGVKEFIALAKKDNVLGFKERGPNWDTKLRELETVTYSS